MQRLLPLLSAPCLPHFWGSLAPFLAWIPPKALPCPRCCLLLSEPCDRKFPDTGTKTALAAWDLGEWGSVRVGGCAHPSPLLPVQQLALELRGKCQAGRSLLPGSERPSPSLEFTSTHRPQLRESQRRGRAPRAPPVPAASHGGLSLPNPASVPSFQFVHSSHKLGAWVLGREWLVASHSPLCRTFWRRSFAKGRGWGVSLRTSLQKVHACPHAAADKGPGPRKKGILVVFLLWLPISQGL